MASLTSVAASPSRLNHEEVIRQSSSAIASNPNHVKALYQRAMTYLHMDQPKKAYADLISILKIYEEDHTLIDAAVPKSTIIERISYFYLSHKRYGHAALSILRGLKESLIPSSDPTRLYYTKDSVKFLLLGAKLCLCLGNRSGVLKNIQHIFSIDPNNKDAQWINYILEHSPQPERSSSSSSSACDAPDQPMQS